jgi:hypothetical protein
MPTWAGPGYPLGLGEQFAAVREADGDAPAVHQSGPRRLWDVFDDIPNRW